MALQDPERYASEENLSAIFTKIETKLNNRYTKAAVDSAIASAISGVTQFDYELVESLPQTGEKGVIYLIANSGTGENLYDEYIWIVVNGTGRYEKFGTKELDLSSYLVKADVKVNTSTLNKTDDSSGNGFTIDLSDATKASLALADTAVQDADLAGFLVGTDVKSDGTYVTKTADASGNGFTFDLGSGVKTSLGKADSALQPSDVEELTTTQVNTLKAIFTDDAD